MNGEQFYKDHIIKWKSLGGSIRSYCRKNEISYDSFQYWRYKKNHVQNLNTSREKKNPVEKLSSKGSDSFIPVEIRDNEDTVRNLSGLEIKIESNGIICIRIGREL